MFRSTIRLLKSGVRFALGKLGYGLIRLPKDSPVSPASQAAGVDQGQSGAESKNTRSPGEKDAFAPVAAEVAAIRKLKQKAFEQTVHRHGDDLGLDFLEPFKTLVHLQHEYRQNLKSNLPAVRIIGRDWLQNIGQIAHLDIYFKLKALGMLEPSETIICLDGTTSVNQSLLSYYAPFASRIVPNKIILGELADYMELLEESTVTVRLADGRAEHLHSLLYEVAEAWQRQGRPPLVSLRPAHRAEGRRWLSSLGLPEEDWFVTFHCRTTVGHQDLRSVRPETYTRAMEAVIRAGGWVVCMGTPKLVDAHPKIINRGDHVTPGDDWKDVFLLADCRFFVGCTSGPADVVNAFGVPSIEVNTLQIGQQAAHNHDLFIPKLFLSRRSGRMLTMEEILEHVGTACGSQTSQLDALGVDIIDNTPEEIEAVVCEMMERLNGTATAPTPQEEAAQQRLREYRQIATVGHGPIMAGKSRMGRDFLQRHGSALGLVNSA